MQIVHYGGDEREVLATDVVVADSLLAQARGLMFRRTFPEGSALVFQFSRAKSRTFHMLFVPFPIDVIWLRDDAVTAVKRLRPWLGLGRASGETVIELPAGAADNVEPGDTVTVES